MNRKILTTAIAVSIALASCQKKETAAATTTSENAVTTAPTATPKGDAYTVDAASSLVNWKGYKVLKSENTSHFGTLKMKDGELMVDGNNLTGGRFVVDLNTLKNEDLKTDAEGQAKLEGHLKSADFFDVAKYPTATYEITSITAGTGDYNSVISGNLTLRGVTKPVQFKANVTHTGNAVSIKSEPTDINRQDFGVNFTSPAENGILKDELTIQLVLNANKK